jgi:hypothetical protein
VHKGISQKTVDAYFYAQNWGLSHQNRDSSWFLFMGAYGLTG